ncbi:DNA-binding protein [Mycobacterium timonense]|uniref:DNA-binding protein n=2 Tax=Mycobacterium avium complex (MAC) TaxID=120793 RepID=A0AAW5S861_MYCBC|nr:MULTISPECIES: hypothetical protein [Mycobacterium avium complex (MAC)]KDP02971.1 hypothetical protein MAV3388_01740 [Mycobacterium avium subsp. hominissuis 3388]MBZ4609149.1 DNA-binding protein [Mycobacterium avium subsp. hominissuis]MCV6991140.1 DNA-binding protein [Mycobacterium bouchedurhonense]MCV6996409.1 DNA-binding protein [Mycobacterium timonense]ORA50277.1 hypothetical protein BST19_15270 [Mycobacterium bouchedurhonense]
MGRKPEPIIDDDDIDLDKEVIHIGDGRRLTEELAEQIAEEAERTSRERSNANLIPGRKSLSGGGEHSPIVQTRVPAQVRARLQAIADRRGVRPSKLLREAIDQFIEREEHRSA